MVATWMSLTFLSNTSSPTWQPHCFKCGTHQQRVQQSEMGKRWNETNIEGKKV